MFSLLKYVPLPLLVVLAHLGAYFAKLSNASIYRSIDTNLMLVKPLMAEPTRKNLAYIALKNQLLSTIMSAKSWAMPTDWSVKQIRTVHNIKVLQAGLANPNGLLVVAPHIGTWEMMNAWLSQFGNMTIMYKPVDNPQMNAFILQGRERLNATLVPTDTSGVKAIFKALKDGGFTVILPDHVPDRNGGEIVPFFGIPTLTGTLTAKLASKTKCAVVGLSCIRRDDGDGFEIFCYDLDDDNLYSKDSIIATTALNHAMERMISQHFDHYMWGYRRFKFTPFGENPYLQDFDTLHQLAKDYQKSSSDKAHS
ncbi:MAG: lysophospholipid acyltransferase family protein [Moraxella sp.]|nr:lysophospholipid acyltransferase family protein [Moraxella sp.]